MLSQIYQVISLILIGTTAAFVALLILRLIFNYADPNPFGAIGRFGFRVKKITEKFVYPATRLFAQFRINTRLAPLVTIFIAVVVAYFTLQIIGNTFFIIKGLTTGAANGNAKMITGFVLYAAISVYILFIFLRFLSSWFVFGRSTFFSFVERVTNPILLPARRIIPTVGMFDISTMLVLILLNFLQSIILNIFVYS